jgi:diaminopropionate ammonia-lyase
MTNSDPAAFDPDYGRARDYFLGLANYAPTPVRTLLPSGDVAVWAKDETNRMGLGAFKALGGPYAVARLIARDWSEQRGETSSPPRFDDPGFRSFAESRAFVCASAGNHGIGVAAGAAAFGASARIYLAETVPAGFDARLKAEGAEVVRAGETYESSVAAAIADSERTGATLLADGTWPGYTEIPKLVMEGYTVMAEELRGEFEKTGNWPTHVYLQAGVGGLAAAMAHMIRENWAEQPELIVVEPAAADCLKRSHSAGQPVSADGPDSNMGRLDCKEPSIVALQTLARCAVSYIVLSEQEGLAASSAITDLGIPTTPSGAAGFGGFLQQQGQHALGRGAKPLIIVTEGPA